MKVKRLGFLLVVTAATLIFCWGVSKNIIHPGSVSGEWVWVYRELDVISKLKLPITVFLCSLGVAVILTKVFQSERVSRKTEIAGLIIISLFTFLAQLSVFSLGRYGFHELPIIGVNDSQTAYLWNAAKIENMAMFLKHFPSLVPQLSCHSATHPPGPIIFFWLLKFLVEKFAFFRVALFNIGGYLRINYSYLSSIDMLIRNPNVYATSILSGLLIPFIASLTVFPLYYLGKEHYNKNVGVCAALLYMYIPSLILFAPQMDQIFTLFAVGIILWLYIGLKRRNLWWIFFSSVLFSFSLFFSFAFLGLLPMGCYLLATGVINKKGKKTRGNFDFRFAGRVSVAFLLPLLAFYASSKIAFHFDMIEVFRAVMVPVNECISQRSYSKWLFYNLYDFFSFLGIPLFLLFARKLILEVKSFAQRENRNRDILFYSLIFTIFVLEMLGKNRGEVARLWLFLVPFAVLVCASEVEKLSQLTTSARHNKRFLVLMISIILVLSLQFIQVLTFKASLETIAIPGLPHFGAYVK